MQVTVNRQPYKTTGLAIQSDWLPLTYDTLWYDYETMFDMELNIKKADSEALYPTYSKVDRGNLVLRHPVPQAPPNIRAFWVAQLNAEFSLQEW